MSTIESTKRTKPDVPPITLDPAAVRLALEDCDGHSILSADGLMAPGLPEAVVRPLIQAHVSGRSDLRSTVFVAGRPVDALWGVYDLDLLRALCEHYGLSTGSPYIGRGSTARLLANCVCAHLDTLAA